MLVLKRGHMSAFLAVMAFCVMGLYAEKVRVLKVIDGTTLLVRQAYEAEGDHEALALSFEEKHGKVGVIGLAGIKLEAFDRKMYEDELISPYGVRAEKYLMGRLSDGVWDFEVDNYAEVEMGGVPYGYLVSQTGAVLNTELIKMGLSPYFYRDDWALRRHMEMVGAEREAVLGYQGIWETQERREFYLLRHKQMARDKDRPAPRLAPVGEVLQDVRKDFSRQDLILGFFLLALMMMVRTKTFEVPLALGGMGMRGGFVFLKYVYKKGYLLASKIGQESDKRLGERGGKREKEEFNIEKENKERVIGEIQSDGGGRA